MLVLQRPLPPLSEEELLLTRTAIILKTLDSVRVISPRQLASLMPPSEKAKPISISKYGKTHTYPDAYDDVVKILRRLEKKGLVKCHRQESEWKTNLWSKPGVKDIINPDNRAHEIDCADLYVAYWRYAPDRMRSWDAHWQDDEIQEYKVYTQGSVLYDARMHFDGRWFFWEVDRGTEGMNTLEEKVDNYIRLFDGLKLSKDVRLHVLFTLQFERYGMGYSPEEKKKAIAKRAKALLQMFHDRRRSQQFLVARHSEVLADPLGPVFVSHQDATTPLSLTDLR